MPIAADRLCIICGERKPEVRFEKKGEHIVPRFLGNRRLRTPFVCRTCNGGLGGTVDIALKGAAGVAEACFNRKAAGWARRDKPVGRPAGFGSLFWEYYGNSGDGGINNVNRRGGDPLKNRAVLGALLKIAYESTHLRLGDAYLGDPVAVTAREILFAFVNKDKGKACELINAICVYRIDINAFHAAIPAPRCEFVKKAVAGRSCLNSIWLVPLTAGKTEPLSVVIDIEGLPPAYVVVAANRVCPPHYAIDTPELIFPRC
jgi:hypothetical protein